MTETIRLGLAERSYTISIGHGMLEETGVIARAVFPGKKVAIVTDSNVDKLYCGKLMEIMASNGFLPYKYVIPAGENSKSWDNAGRICSWLIENGMTRSDLVIALGGGVVGDITGFCASITLRGIPYLQMPTTLLAQVDSSVGGKTGVNFSGGKNMLGSFYQPEMVVIDPLLLKTLEDRRLSEGMAEVIKYACIRSSSLYSFLENLQGIESVIGAAGEIIASCCRIKADIVERDEMDKGERMLLNFGHTLGHAIEKYFDYDRFTHGEGVAIGMLAAARAGERAGLTEAGTADNIEKMLARFNLMLPVPGMDVRELVRLMAGDKKNMADTLSVVMLRKIGEGFLHPLNIKEIASFFFEEAI